MPFIKGIEGFLQKPGPGFLPVIEQMNQFGIIGQSKSIVQAYTKAQKAAQSNANILIEGESGTGKENLFPGHPLYRKKGKRPVRKTQLR